MSRDNRADLPKRARSTGASICCAAALTLSAGTALATARDLTTHTKPPKKVVIVETVDGPVVKCHQWGYMQVQLKISKTVVGSGPNTIASIQIRQLTDVTWPVFPNHTSRSIYINQQALPLLQYETFKLQANAAQKLQVIAGATNTTDAWKTSLQAALQRAEKP
jgi:uncharacterized protein with FMN-binding domain